MTSALVHRNSTANHDGGWMTPVVVKAAHGDGIATLRTPQPFRAGDLVAIERAPHGWRLVQTELEPA